MNLLENASTSVQITDGQELTGYNLTWMETSEDSTIQHGPFTYYSNPTDEHNAYYDTITGRYIWRDIDTDGISDYNETHYNDTYQWLVTWAWEKHNANPDDFNATEYLENQFNPFVKASFS